MIPTSKESLLMHPPNYVEVQICPAIKSPDVTKEIVWTYLVGRKYENDHQGLAEILCGEKKTVPDDSRIWLEAHLYPKVGSKGERPDLSMGYVKKVQGTRLQIRSNGPNWVCFGESKFFSDMGGDQYQQLIVHALLLNDMNSIFSDRVYVTLITPRYFKDGIGKFSKTNYWTKYHAYQPSKGKLDKEKLAKDLLSCNSHFLENHYDRERLITRIDSLALEWVALEDLLGLPDLVRDQVPGKYQISFNTWEEVLKQIGREDLFDELQNKR